MAIAFARLTAFDSCPATGRCKTVRLELPMKSGGPLHDISDCAALILIMFGSTSSH